ncbi:hypothetical protein ccbrp13_30000 [Ktedonobacteria bacterium brp13]|nr:hypothetical protein ccbrp13_30000 [Ktedonobacteria bacterium brp13]
MYDAKVMLNNRSETIQGRRQPSLEELITLIVFDLSEATLRAITPLFVPG